MKIPDEKMAELRAQNPRGLMEKELSDGSQWVFKKPSADQWRACKGALNIALATGDAPMVASAQERLAHECCVYPGADAFQALRDEDPAIAGRFGEQLFAMVGTGRSIVEGKAEISPAKP